MNIWLNRIAYGLQGLLVLLFVVSITLKLMGVPSETAAFAKLDMGGTGMYVTMLAEVLCITGLVTMRFVIQGAVLAILSYSMSVFLHLTELEIIWWNDGGLRFYLSLTGLVSSIGLFVIRNHLANILYRKGKLD